MQYGCAFCGEYPQRGENIHKGLAEICFWIGREVLKDWRKNGKSPCFGECRSGAFLGVGL